MSSRVLESWHKELQVSLRGQKQCKKKGLFLLKCIYLLLAELGLCCSVWASLVAERGLLATGSEAVVHGLRCSTACTIFLVQGLNVCCLHWHADF